MQILKVKDKNYLKFLRTRQCAICGWPPPSEPHHIRGIDGLPGTGRKPSDHLAIPVCKKPDGTSCHDDEQKYHCAIHNINTHPRTKYFIN